MQLNTVEELITDIRHGKMVILMDDEDRENEGDLVMAAVHVRPEDINFMITHARGLVCLPITKERGEQLQLPLMVQKNGTSFGTNFTVSIEAAEGVETGISPADRARTIQAAISPFAKASDIVQPGHVFPLIAAPGGVLHRAGHTEAGCDLAKLAGLEPAAVIVEIINEDGSMARRHDLEKFAQKHNLKIGTIADLIHYRMINEQTVERIHSQTIHTKHGSFELHQYQEQGSQDIHIALVKGKPDDNTTSTVRVHGFQAARDLLLVTDDKSSPRWNVHDSLEYIANAKHGVFVMINESEKLDFSSLITEISGDTKNLASYRSTGVGAQILKDLGVKRMNLLSSPLKFNALSGFDIEVVDYISASSVLSSVNQS